MMQEVPRGSEEQPRALDERKERHSCVSSCGSVRWNEKQIAANSYDMHITADRRHQPPTVTRHLFGAPAVDSDNPN